MRCDPEELRAHLVTVAQLAVDDPAFLPYFHWLEAMIATAEARDDTMSRVRAVARQKAIA